MVNKPLSSLELYCSSNALLYNFILLTTVSDPNSKLTNFDDNLTNRFFAET